MAKYYYSSEGRTLGPVSPEEILYLILDDKLTSDSYVMEGKTPQWIKIRDIPDLMRHLQQSPERLPASEIENVKVLSEDTSEPLFYHIPLGRLIVGSLVSLGLFEWYWLYKNWHFLRWVRRDRSFGYSFWRDMVNPFRVIYIFQKIASDKELNRALPCPGNFGMPGILWLLTWFASHFLFLIPVQNYINACNAKLGRRYTETSFGHYLTLILGGIGWLVLLLRFVF